MPRRSTCPLPDTYRDSAPSVGIARRRNATRSAACSPAPATARRYSTPTTRASPPPPPLLPPSPHFHSYPSLHRHSSLRPTYWQGFITNQAASQIANRDYL